MRTKKRISTVQQVEHYVHIGSTSEQLYYLIYFGILTLESDGFGPQKSDRKTATVSSRARSHHSKPSSASMARDYKEETSKKRKVTEEKVTEEQQRQVVKFIIVNVSLPHFLKYRIFLGHTGHPGR